MKLVKIIVITISIIVVGFLSIGFLIKETKYSTEISIEKPLTEVFSKFNDASNLKEWIPEFKSIEIIEEKPAIKGSKYKVTIENRGQEIVMEEKVLAYVPNEKVTLFYNTGAGNMLKTDTYLFKEEGNTTKIIHNTICRSNGYLMACMFPIFKSKFKDQDQEYLNNFKKFIENK